MLNVFCFRFYSRGFNFSKVLFVLLLLIPLLECYEVSVLRALCFIGGLGAEGAQIIILLQLVDYREATTFEPQWVIVRYGSTYNHSMGEISRVSVFYKAVFQGKLFFCWTWNVLQEGVYFKDVLAEKFGKECLFWLLCFELFFFQCFIKVAACF